MDVLKSHDVTRTRLYRDGREIWVRWYPAAPDAKTYPGWHAFGHPAWEEEWDRDTFRGPGCLYRGRRWRRKRYPAPPGLDYIGTPDDFEFGLESDAGMPPDEQCGTCLLSSSGGVIVDGTSSTSQSFRSTLCACSAVSSTWGVEEQLYACTCPYISSTWTQYPPTWYICVCKDVMSFCYTYNMYSVICKCKSVSSSFYFNNLEICKCKDVSSTWSFATTGTISVSCCPGVLLPSTVTATITGGTGDCGCLEGTYTLVWDGGAAWWAATALPCPTCLQPTFDLELECVVAGSSYLFSLRSQHNGITPGVYAQAGWTCSPLHLVFVLTTNAGDSNRNCTGTFTVTITA